MFRIWPYSVLLSLCIAPAIASGTDIVADTMTRNAAGAVVADGNVIIQRKGETLTADQVVYDAKAHQLTATGHVKIENKQSIIYAESGKMDTQNKSGTLNNVKAELATGERINADTFYRQDEKHFHADNVTLSNCPIDAESWRIKAAHAEVDQEKGFITARHVRFEIGDIPVYYTPYWSHPLRRMSGFLMPGFGSSKSRGTEWSLPYYLAPAENWDATLTPRWMTARGFQGDIEFRHVSQRGQEHIQLEGMKDRQLSKNRSRIRGQIDHTMPYNLYFSAKGDHVSDRHYLADLETEQRDASISYLQSTAKLSGAWKYGHASLFVRHQNNLTLTSNAGTLQILPQIDTSLHTPIETDGIHFYFNHQTTRFDRKSGVDGLRVDLNPYLEVPWRFAGGSIQSILHLGGRHTRYRLQDTIGSLNPHRSSFEASLENRIQIERISDNQLWRHAFTPVIRYDFVTAPDQQSLPNFDSGFAGLSINNLMSGNRFSGKDRIERTHRISIMLENELQYKSTRQQPSRTLAQWRIGAAYDLKRESVDSTLTPTTNRLWSNLLGDLVLHPTRNISLSASGQYDITDKFWATSQTNLHIQSDNGHSASVGWSRTDVRYSTPAELITSTGRFQLGQRWQTFGTWNYDARLKSTQQATIGLHYTHPCWDISLEGFRTNINGSTSGTDTGFRFLIGFKGLGSVGSSS